MTFTKKIWAAPAPSRDLIDDKAWGLIQGLLPKGAHTLTVRNFLEAVAFQARTGCPWRDLPERFGPWHAIWTRWNSWAKKGWMEQVNALVVAAVGPELSEASLDSTCSKLHKSAHGSKKKAKPSAKAKADGTPK